MDSVNKQYVLHVEDDFGCRRKMNLMLDAADYIVVGVSRSADARELFPDHPWALAVIHLGAEQEESLDLCRWIKSRSSVPVLMMTDRNEVVTEAMAMTAGADDYITKPVNETLFKARAAVLTGKSRANLVTETHDDVLTWGVRQTAGSPATLLARAVLAIPGSSSYMKLDLDQHQFFVGKTEISLTKSEFLIMRILMENQRQVLTRGQLLDAVGIGSAHGSDQVIDAHISRLRIKIRRECGEDVLKAVHGVGFRLATAVYLTVPEAKAAPAPNSLALI
jgi:two-component system response regulator RegX3